MIDTVALIVGVIIGYFVTWFLGYRFGVRREKNRFVKDYKAGEFIVDLKNPQMNVTGEVPNTYMKTTEHLENVVQKPYALYTIRWLTKD